MVLMSTLLILILAIIPTGKSELTNSEDDKDCTQSRSTLMYVRKTYRDPKNDTVWAKICTHYKRFEDCIEGKWYVNETVFLADLKNEYEEKCKSYLASSTAVFGLTFVYHVMSSLFFVIAVFHRY
ncbi:hypothetical protein Ddc_15510 [Ditylenchus destructor]|nr:hypothetical protein Ddc_15510 [Ditylenchus destructor]